MIPEHVSGVKTNPFLLEKYFEILFNGVKIRELIENELYL